MMSIASCIPICAASPALNKGELGSCWPIFLDTPTWFSLSFVHQSSCFHRDQKGAQKGSTEVGFYTCGLLWKYELIHMMAGGGMNDMDGMV